ncbi:MAG TPA: dual specificity protein phosphatase [Polyangia bacterium]|nr:dual specificity protein phosphatase [Polyangia bacterium]
MDERKRSKTGGGPKRRAGAAKREAAAMRLNFDWLTEVLAVGGCFPIQAAERLALEHGISRVVDLRDEDCDEELSLARHGIRLLHLPTQDCCAIARDSIAHGVAWVRAALRAKHRVLIHCQHGIGRSALLAMCVLVDQGMSPLAAMKLAKDARAVISPSPDQLRALMAFAAERRAGETWTVPSFDELAAIAYRHLNWQAGEVGSGTTP